MSNNDLSSTSLDDLLADTIDISTVDMHSVTLPPTPYYGNITIAPTTGPLGQYTYNNTILSNGTYSTTNPGLHVSGNAEFEGDIKIKGKSILKFLETIEKRLAILQPDPAKLEKFAALRKAYEHYKTLEALCDLEEKKED